MADLNIPNLNKKSEKYLFKKRLSLRRKSKKKLLTEAFLMLISSFSLLLINYLIPNKTLLFSSFLNSLSKCLILLFDLL